MSCLISWLNSEEVGRKVLMSESQKHRGGVLAWELQRGQRVGPLGENCQKQM